jgi:predicted nucleotide-binding protein
LNGSAKDRAVPRDSVVFEAGYFSVLKGKSRVLIVLESGAKMPADLGGDIYASLEDKEHIDPIKPVLQRFLEIL